MSCNIKKYKIITKIDKSKLIKYKEINNIKSLRIILTNERKKHIYDKHTKDYDLIMKKLKETLDNPDDIRVSKIDSSEIHYIKKIDYNNQIEIVKMSINDDLKHPDNSIMTSWLISDTNLIGVKRKTKSIYKSDNK